MQRSAVSDDYVPLQIVSVGEQDHLDLSDFPPHIRFTLAGVKQTWRIHNSQSLIPMFVSDTWTLVRTMIDDVMNPGPTLLFLH